MWLAIISTVILQLLIVFIPFLQNIFKTKALNWELGSIILIEIFVCTLLFEFIKLINKRKYLKTV